MPIVELTITRRAPTRREMDADMVRVWNMLHAEDPVWDIDERDIRMWEEVYVDCMGAD